MPFTSPHSISILIAFYLFFVLKWGPRFMQHRKSYNLERILLFYNAIQVILNFTLLAFVSTPAYRVVALSFRQFVFPFRVSLRLQCLYEINFKYEGRVNFMCESLDFSDSYVGLRSAQSSYCYLLLKILDLFDTVFFVLRKRTRQISFLHVYHHVAVLIGSWIAVSWAPGIISIAKFEFYSILIDG